MPTVVNWIVQISHCDTQKMEVEPVKKRLQKCNHLKGKGLTKVLISLTSSYNYSKWRLHRKATAYSLVTMILVKAGHFTQSYPTNRTPKRCKMNMTYFTP